MGEFEQKSLASSVQGSQTSRRSSLSSVQGSQTSGSSLLSRTSLIFNKKQRGSSPEALRGSLGADFENYGRISEGMDGINCGCFGRGEGNRLRLILVKGPFIFVFENEKCRSPKFVVALQDMRVQVKRPASSGQVLLEPNLDGAKYELTLQTEAIAEEFIDAVREQQYGAATDLVRRRLGHNHLHIRSTSVIFAEAVALETLLREC